LTHAGIWGIEIFQSGDTENFKREPRQTRERGLTLKIFRRKLNAMPSNFDEAFAAVQSLAKDFDAQKDFHLSPKYQEAEVRKEFIDKFLIAPGWDVNPAIAFAR
jgi:hypothetical protein